MAALAAFIAAGYRFRSRTENPFWSGQEAPTSRLQRGKRFELNRSIQHAQRCQSSLGDHLICDKVPPHLKGGHDTEYL